MVRNANDVLPSRQQIRDAVVQIIASFAKRDPADIADANEVVKDLRIPDSSMPFLALSLRGHISTSGRSARLA